MRILYKQPHSGLPGSLDRYGITSCYFKKLSLDHDSKIITKKVHQHTSFELHIIMDGCQTYAVSEKTYKLEKGSFLLLYPNTAHTAVASAPHTEKYSFTFCMPVEENRDCFSGQITARMCDNLKFVLNEEAHRKAVSDMLIENCILELIVSSFRLSGITERANACCNYSSEENTILFLAKQYIEDNIENAPGVCDIADYCCLSTKQLTRIFDRFEGISPGEYITKQRIQKIEKMLADDTYSIRQISEEMNFSSEYYFSVFVKKHLGLPPGEYRKMFSSH